MFARRDRVDHDEVRWQGSLFALSATTVDPAFGGLVRRQLDRDSWVDYVPNWLGGSDDVCRELLATMPWVNRRVRMYDRMLDEPRLSAWWTASSAHSFPIASISEIRSLLAIRYDRDFDSIGCNYYRDGRDSVAWHADKLPGIALQPIIAIVSVGTRRPFLLRRSTGGPSIRYELGDGDLMVMGGQSQVGWQHTVPKVAQCGPRISVTFRHGATAP